MHSITAATPQTLVSVTTIAWDSPYTYSSSCLFRVLPQIHSRLLKALQRTAAEDSPEYVIPNLHFDSSIPPYALFRESIVRQLFGSDALLRLRLKFAITDFCWVRSSLFLSFPAPA